VESGPDGLCQIVMDTNDPGSVFFAVKPDSGAWHTAHVGIPVDGVLECEPISDEAKCPWWLDELGLLGEMQPVRDVSLGILDTSFGDSPLWTEIEQTEASQIPEDGEPHHGYQIASLLALRPDTGEEIAAGYGASLLVYAAGDTEAPSKVRMAGAIDGLIALTDGGADIITMSFGQVGAADEGMCQALEYAVSRGVLLIAASGNEGESEPAFPASDARVVGVSAYGYPAQLPESSFASITLSRILPGEKSCELGNGRRYWPWSNQVTGKDVCGPGCGIIVRLADGRLIDVFGTSFSAPLVAAVAAAHLATESTNIDVNNRLEVLRSVLYSSCINPGSDDLELIGAGCPVYG
jgi:subtilisin family serine protease